MEQKFCQSCGMPLNEHNHGTNADDTPGASRCTTNSTNKASAPYLTPLPNDATDYVSVMDKPM